MAHGVFFEELTAAGAQIRTQGTTVVGLAAPVPAGSTGFAVDDFVVLRGSTDVSALGLPTDSDLQRQLDAVFAQSLATVILFGTDPGANQAEAATNIAGSASLNTGVYKFKESTNLVGFKPNQICAPGFSETSVHTALVGCSEAIRSVCILDGPSTDDAAAISAAGSVTDNEGRAAIIDPAVTLGANTIATSSHAAGIYAGTDWWKSPSNVGINGIDGTARPIFHELTNPADQAQTLNDAKIVTVVRSDGFRLWGNRNLAADGYSLPFISDRRADDVIQDAIAQAHRWWVDRGITKTFADLVLESVNSFLRQQVALGRLVGGEASLDPEINTPASLAAGQIYIDYEVTFIPPAESITFRRSVTNRFLSVITG